MSIRKLAVKMMMLCLVSSPAGAVTKVPSTVALEVTTPLTVFYGEAIDGLAQVTTSDGSVATGTVTFYDGTTSFCTLTLANGVSCAESATKGFGAGTHVFTAVYSGDATHAGATSNAVTVTVKQDTTTTALASSANPVAVGGGAVYAATVAGAHGPVSGMVTFLDGTVAMGSTTLNGSGTAALSVLMLVAGDHAVTAVYAGDGNSLGSTSAVLHETVQGTLAATTTTLAASANPVIAGASVTLTAKVAGSGKAVPSGKVSFVDGGAVLGSAVVSAGAAAWSTSGLSVGSHSIVAQYAGDGTTAGSVSAALTVVVNQQQAGQGPPAGLTIDAGTITVAAGDTVSVPVLVNGGSGAAKAVSLSCSGLPEEASCSYVSGSSGAAAGAGTATLRIVTSAPRDCGASTPYGAPAKSALLPVAGLLLLLVPGRRRAVRGLLTVVCTVLAMGAMTGCGTGNCTDLGTRPGTYTITVTGNMGGTQVSQKVKLVVTP
ncbi:Ig-like domain-containing protein [Edaphobacter modestus]|uniref:Ig-like domain-containing protein n=1 Tax=Edaphobacter modestus TaxID=388466 RepID=A0A4Q7YXQ8_9BACT|nr:Ig-like domain-containing protein [Edaphobacter modestus]RZU42560.1 Ig-like domain-containing protein [Edaphobacter modestus]